jgi:hypothetical protein
LHPELVQKDILPAPPLRTTDRIIVFLRKPGVPPEYDLGNPKESVIGWQPANFWEELRASTIWPQDGVAYGYGQTINPGYSHLGRLRVTEEQDSRADSHGPGPARRDGPSARQYGSG